MPRAPTKNEGVADQAAEMSDHLQGFEVRQTFSILVGVCHVVRTPLSCDVSFHISMRKIKTQPNISRRVIATLIDFIIYLPIWFAYVMYFGEPGNEGGYSVTGFKALPLLAFWFFYFPAMETLKGQTIGHMVTGLKVVTLSGNPISLGQAIKRRLLDAIDIFATFGLVAFITVKNSERHQRVGDQLAKTIVVGGETVNCNNCNQQLTLSAEDTINATFECPECGTKAKTSS